MILLFPFCGTNCSVPRAFKVPKIPSTLPKFNSSPLKSDRNAIGKDRLPTTIFQGRTVKPQGCTSLGILINFIGVKPLTSVFAPLNIGRAPKRKGLRKCQKQESYSNGSGENFCVTQRNQPHSTPLRLGWLHWVIDFKIRHLMTLQNPRVTCSSCGRRYPWFSRC